MGKLIGVHLLLLMVVSPIGSRPTAGELDSAASQEEPLKELLQDELKATVLPIEEIENRLEKLWPEMEAATNGVPNQGDNTNTELPPTNEVIQKMLAEPVAVPSRTVSVWIAFQRYLKKEHLRLKQMERENQTRLALAAESAISSNNGNAGSEQNSYVTPAPVTQSDVSSHGHAGYQPNTAATPVPNFIAFYPDETPIYSSDNEIIGYLQKTYILDQPAVHTHVPVNVNLDDQPNTYKTPAPVTPNNITYNGNVGYQQQTYKTPATAIANGIQSSTTENRIYLMPVTKRINFILSDRSGKNVQGVYFVIQSYLSQNYLAYLSSRDKVNASTALASA